MSYKLIRERDGLTVVGSQIAWIKWDESGRAQSSQDKIEVGLSLIVDPQRFSYTWLTTTVTEVLEEKEFYTRFKTTNSEYELTMASHESKPESDPSKI